eukprot:TRINITY_DN3011_c0_g1_i3.p1 TRINITY_DN3011_c0_g1~~TRINITY_DN3011_c0_g1_i3.p1  ORF type:complete len:669 (-),score=104.13 TRINITY_DN3011_c0_g1_i3:103-2109(-)
MIRRPPRSTRVRSSAASDVYKRQQIIHRELMFVLMIERIILRAFFKPHYDGMYKNQHGECSIFTVTLYLNDDYEGGRLLFLDDAEVKSEEIAERIKGTPSAKEPELLYAYQPKQGSALIFNHDTFHEGEIVRKGVKYIARTSIMFRRVQDLSDPKRLFEQDPMWQKSKTLFSTFCSLMAKGDTHQFTLSYLEAQAMQLKLGSRCLHSPPVMPDTLPLDILFNIFQFLDDPRDFAALMTTCKAWNAMMRTGYVWKDLYSRKWGRDACAAIKKIPTTRHGIKGSREMPDNIDDGLIDWYGIFRNRYCLQHKCSSIFSYVSGMAYASHNGFTRITPARVADDSAPWDYSYNNFYTTEYGQDYFYLSNQNMGFSSRTSLKIKFSFISQIWKEQLFGRRNDRLVNNTAILIVHPLLWDIRTFWPSPRYMCFGGSGTTSWNEFAHVPSTLEVSYQHKMKTIRMLSRNYDVQSICMIDAELCALYSCNKQTSGIVIYKLERLINCIDAWEIMVYQNSKMINCRVFPQQEDESPTEKVISTVESFIKDHFPDGALVLIACSESYDPTTFADSVNMWGDDRAIVACEVRVREANMIQNELSKLSSVTAKRVNAEDVLSGAEMYFVMHGITDKMMWASDLFQQAFPDYSYSNCLKYDEKTYLNRKYHDPSAAAAPEQQ